MWLDLGKHLGHAVKARHKIYLVRIRKWHGCRYVTPYTNPHLHFSKEGFATLSVPLLWKWCWRLCIARTLKLCASNININSSTVCVWMCRHGPWQDIDIWRAQQENGLMRLWPKLVQRTCTVPLGERGLTDWGNSQNLMESQRGVHSYGIVVKQSETERERERKNKQKTRTEKSMWVCRQTDMKDVQGLDEYSCNINGCKTTWKPFAAEHLLNNTFYGSVHQKSALFWLF